MALSRPDVLTVTRLYRPDHLPAQPRALGEARTEKLSGLLEALAIQVEAPEAHRLAPTPRSDDELEVVCAVGDVAQRGLDRGVQARRRPEEVLRDADPQPEERRRGERQVHERVDAERRPAVDHREQRKVRVGVIAAAATGTAGGHRADWG